MKAKQTRMHAGKGVWRVFAIIAACATPFRSSASSSSHNGLHTIRHVMMPGNRSFDTYFVTYSGAYGIPMEHGVASLYRRLVSDELAAVSPIYSP
jgi:phospholipase C